MTTPQPKPLSETHPALWKEWTKDRPWLEDEMTGREIIQKCTVDIAEHNRVQDDLIESLSREHKQMLDVDRLQKELETLREQDCMCDSYDVGLVEGERRAMERVNVAMAKACCGEGCFDKTDFYKELSLSEVRQ